MSMSIILNGRVWLPHHSKDLKINIKGKNVWLPEELDGVCSISVRLGDFYGYELADYLRIGTTDGFAGSDWLFGCDAANDFIHSAKEDIKNGSVSFVEDLKEIVDALEKALNNGYEEFEISLWY